MLKKLLNFIKYNNTAAFIFTIIFSGASASLAASPAVRNSVYESTQAVTSIDNTAILSADLQSFDFTLKINSVTEDADKYYATYSYATLAIEDSVWKKVTITKVLTVEKASLEGKDLGLDVAQELSENINAELAYLIRVQELEKEKGKSDKVVTIEYSGLVGKFLDPKEQVIEGYDPVIPAEVLEEDIVLDAHGKPYSPVILDEGAVRDIINKYLKENNITPVNEEKAPTPDPTPDPEGAPDPTPDPIVDSDPVSDPLPTPDPVPEPNPAPDPAVDPTPASTPEPDPLPEPVVTPDPAPGSEAPTLPPPTPDSAPAPTSATP